MVGWTTWRKGLVFFYRFIFVDQVRSRFRLTTGTVTKKLMIKDALAGIRTHAAALTDIRQSAIVIHWMREMSTKVSTVQKDRTTVLVHNVNFTCKSYTTVIRSCVVSAESIHNFSPSISA